MNNQFPQPFPGSPFRPESPPLNGFYFLYVDPNDPLPQPLPSPSEIDSSPYITQGCLAGSVKQVGEHYFIKYGRTALPSEAANMIFARSYLGDIVPRVWAVYQTFFEDLPGAITYIVMGNFGDRSLEDIWPNLTESIKSSVHDQLSSVLRTMRNIPHPGFFGNLAMMYDDDALGYGFTRRYNPIHEGPFETEELFIDAVIDQHEEYAAVEYRHKTPFYRRVLPQALRVNNARPVFTHCDLQPCNIMLGSNGKITIIDWVEAGWYPTWWEYVNVMRNNDWRNDWGSYAHRWMPAFRCHSACVRLMFNEIQNEPDPESDASMSSEV